MKVLLCLVTDQHVPNLLSVHHFQPDRVVLVRSAKMAKATEFFLDALAIAQFPEERVDVLPLDDENNLASVRRCLHHAFGKYPEADWIANVTGGLKPMSIAAYEFFKALDARIVYIDSRSPNEILGLDGQLPETCTHLLSLDEFMAGYGFQISKAWPKIAESEDRARNWWPLARVIAEHAPDLNLLRFSDDAPGRDEWKAVREKGFTLEPRHTQHIPQPVLASLVECWNLASSDMGTSGSIDKYQGMFLTGGWLEAFLWKLLADHASLLGLEHVHLGVEARKKDTHAPTDFDVAFLMNQSLGTIECKSGGQEHSDDPNQPLDKLEARIQQFRALRVTPVLATTSPKILDANHAVKATFAQRAAIYNCRIVTVHQIRELASEHATPELIGHILLNRK